MTVRRRATVLLGLALLSSIVAPPAAATVSRVTVQSRQDVLGGRAFGTAGGYEKLVGVVEFALDPVNAANAAIVDLAHAQKDASGRVIASANFMVLRPKTMPRERAVALLEVGNRGGKAALPYFARAAWSLDPAAEAEFGDALPLRLGLTLIWVGWQFDDGETRIARAGDFEPGKLYELVYRARDPVVVGIGLAAVRDMMSYAKYDAASLFPVRWGVGLGISQTGRFLRHFVYQGFNTDEARRSVFDGLFVHTAGAGRGSFNHRFAQPSRDAHRFSAFFYPTDVYPFTGRSQGDPETGMTDGLFAHEPNLPKIFFTNTGYEYWGRAASLIHVTPTGDADIEPLPSERIYHLAGGQHFVVDRPAMSEQSDTVVAYRYSPLDFHPALRSLLTRPVEWVRGGREPPPSAYPRLDSGTLVALDRVRAPAISGAAWPRVAHEAYR